ncbi:YjeF N-terminal domain-like protein [Catenaria anguillulae PL171]|uniref:NAD(P)H-hydrate epimerase n=1 Tax=Catenaria anguillulae PL171 TaxID=765915 RepID=A0A1Y2HK01_9FUNG|nr:YjeF N-terminal domain-like protein [Catenaria anguillulae PL171]
MHTKPITYLTQRLAQAVDTELMSPAGGFSIDQLMELAGLAVAQAAARVFPLQPKPPGIPPTSVNRVVLCCGPGNNGGDGLVAARHLAHFGYTPIVYYPKPTDKPLFRNVTQQLRNLDVLVLGSDASSTIDSQLQHAYFVVDALFGFSFAGPIRSPFDDVIKKINESHKPVLSVDIPSGWDVEKGPMDAHGLDTPYALISLTAPKLGASGYTGIHFVGGRFVPPAMARRLGLDMPEYSGADQIVQISGLKV